MWGIRMPLQVSRDRVDADVIVIGGGVNGTGVARDAALRGLRGGALRAQRPRVRRERQLERDDPRRPALPHVRPRRDVQARASTPGTSSASRRTSLFRIPFLMPVQRRFGSKVDALRARRVLRRLRQVPAAQARQAPRAARRRRGAHARAGARRRARGRRHLRRVGHRRRAPLRRQRGRRARARRRDPHALHGDRVPARARTAASSACASAIGSPARRGRARANVVVNATGAWAPHHGRARRRSRPGRRALRPGKGIHVVFDRRLTNYAIGVEPSTVGRSSSSRGRT